MCAGLTIGSFFACARRDCVCVLVLACTLPLSQIFAPSMSRPYPWNRWHYEMDVYAMAPLQCVLDRRLGHFLCSARLCVRPRLPVLPRVPTASCNCGALRDSQPWSSKRKLRLLKRLMIPFLSCPTLLLGSSIACAMQGTGRRLRQLPSQPSLITSSAFPWTFSDSHRRL